MCYQEITLGGNQGQNKIVSSKAIWEQAITWTPTLGNYDPQDLLTARCQLVCNLRAADTGKAWSAFYERHPWSLCLLLKENSVELKGSLGVKRSVKGRTAGPGHLFLFLWKLTRRIIFPKCPTVPGSYLGRALHSISQCDCWGGQNFTPPKRHKWHQHPLLGKLPKLLWKRPDGCSR